MTASVWGAFPHRRRGFRTGFIRLHLASFGDGQGTPPESFRRRLRAEGGSQTFRDPAFLVGGGMDISVSRRLAVRPEVESMIVWRDGRRYVVTSVSMQLSVLFEPHSITPARPARPR